MIARKVVWETAKETDRGPAAQKSHILSTSPNIPFPGVAQCPQLLIYKVVIFLYTRR